MAATSPINRILEPLDRLQRRHPLLSLPIAVFKRFGEHNGGRLVTTLAYWSFFSIFPLLLAFVTILNLVLKNDPELRQDLVDGALGQVPVLGTDLADSQTSLGGSWTTVAIGLLVAVWTGLAAANALHTALDDIADTPGYKRPNGALLRARSFLFLLILALGITVSTVTINAAGIFDLGRFSNVFTFLVTFLVDALILLAAFSLLTTERTSMRALLPGTLVAAFLVTAMQALGSLIVRRYIAGASDTYGTFAVVIALLSWFYLLSRVVLLSAELNAVLRRRLVPRSLVGTSRLTEADRLAAVCDAQRVQRDRRVAVAVTVADESPGVPAP